MLIKIKWLEIVTIIFYKIIIRLSEHWSKMGMLMRVKIGNLRRIMGSTNRRNKIWVKMWIISRRKIKKMHIFWEFCIRKTNYEASSTWISITLFILLNSLWRHAKVHSLNLSIWDLVPKINVLDLLFIARKTIVFDMDETLIHTN